MCVCVYVFFSLYKLLVLNLLNTDTRIRAIILADSARSVRWRWISTTACWSYLALWVMVSRWMTWWRNSVTGCGLLWMGGVPIHHILKILEWMWVKLLASNGFACCCPIAHSRCCRRRPWRNSSCPSLSPWCIRTMRQSWMAIHWTEHAVC